MRLVLLAAGNSRRFGENKLLFPLEGKPLYRYMLDRLLLVRAEMGAELVVVTQYGEIAQACAGLPTRVLLNPESEKGISTSIRLGLSDIAEIPCAFFVADQPYLSEETIVCFLRAWASSGKGIGCVAHEGESGNPAVFASRYHGALRALAGDRGGKRVIREHMDDTYLHQVENARALMDIDFRGDAVSE